MDLRSFDNLQKHKFCIKKQNFLLLQTDKECCCIPIRATFLSQENQELWKIPIIKKLPFITFRQLIFAIVLKKPK